MNNKYLYVVMAAVMGTVAYYVLHMAYFGAVDGAVAERIWYAAILAVGLGAGSTGGSDVVSILVEGIKGYVGTMINLAIFGVVIHLIITLGILMIPFDPMALVASAVGYVVTGLLTNLTLSYLKKAA